MRYFSTRRNSPLATFKEAIELGQPADKGLFFPSEIARFPSEFLKDLRTRSNAEIAFQMIRPYIDGEIHDAELFRICSESVDFPFPLVQITPTIFALELFHGPTLAFKDVGAGFMSRCLSYFSKDRATKTLVIVATSGDTGGAVASGFEAIDGVEVVILYPIGRVSSFQEAQLNELRSNVTTLAVRGNFDECQALAKTALIDPELRRSAFVTSANSINIARWLPQQSYYAFALKDWDGDPPLFSVPSGNFGNMAAGLLAQSSGLPIKSFIAACNANDTVPRFLQTTEFEPRPSIKTLSNAMDVGDPSNLPRVLEIFDQDVDELKRVMTAVTVSDAATTETMKRVFAENNYVLDPHGAVGYRGLADHLLMGPEDRGIFLETAHPIKFDVVRDIIGNYDVALKPAAEGIERTEIDPDYEQLREILRSKI
jgi:threonine synthase